MSPGVTFERVYLALKEQLGSGCYAAGQQLEPAALSADLNVSITPVRDALHRLVGERLAEAPRGDGFRTPLVTEVGLRHLYRWNAALLQLAARSLEHGSEPVGDFSNPLFWTEALFLAIARVSGNPEHVEAIDRLNERLRPMRRLEFELVAAEAELETIAAALDDGAPVSLRRALLAYHRRRERLAAEIVERLHKAGQT